jgi:hypothetical protein
MNEHTVAMKPYNEAVDKAKKDVEEATKTGNKSRVDAANLALNNVQRDRDNQRAEHTKEQTELKGVHDKLVKVQQEEVEARQKQVDTINRAPQLGYAEGLKLGGILHRNKAAAENIEKAAKKSKADKDSDKIFELLEKAAKKDDAKPAEKAPDAH